jgi:DNA-binding CsgD family transcriptional regulator
MVGRAVERALLGDAARAALERRRQVVVIAGEPGGGKTRLAEDAVDQARSLGLACAYGRAVEEEGTPPYWPMRQVLRALAIPAVEFDRTDERERFQLFEAIAGALVVAAEPAGLLVVLDDLQWADAATLHLLVHLAAATDPARLVVVATYRDTELAGRESLRVALAALARETVVTRIHLGGLSPAEVAQRLAALTGWAVRESVAADIWRRTGGNPFFVGELGRVLASAKKGKLPAGVRDAIRDRLDRLSPGTRRLVEAAAVLGSTVDVQLLAQAADATIQSTLDAVDEAERAGILTETRAFVHDLIWEAARLDVPTAARLELHRRAAEWLGERSDADVRVAEVATHWLESLPAGDAARAADWARRAADRAMAHLAWEEAAELYGRAVAAGDASGALPASARAELLLAQARALVRAFDLEAARLSLVAVVEIAREANDARLLAQAALAMEGVNHPAWDDTAGAVAREALAGLPTMDSPVRARLLALTVVAANWSIDADADPRSAEALAMADRLADPHALREALRARQMALSGPDGATGRLAIGDRLVRLGSDGDDDAVLWGRLWRFDALAQLGDLAAAEAEVERIDVVARRLRSPMAAWHVARCRAAVAAARGRIDEAMAHGHAAEKAALRAGTAGAHLPSQGLLTMLRNLVGDYSPSGVARIPVNRSTEGFVRSMHITWLLGQGRVDEARQVYESLPTPDELAPFVRLVGWAGLAELAAEFEDRDLAARTYDLLLPYADRFVCSGAGVIMILGTVRYPLGLAAATMGRTDEAVRHLRAAVSSGERCGMPLAVAQSTFQLARVLARRTRPADRTEAAALATSAAVLAERVGLKPLHERAKALAEALAGKAAGPLTRREREVAELVAQGLSNRGIAAAIHTSERTVETHVRHILEKLGLRNRTQVSAWLAGRRADLRTPPA